LVSVALTSRAREGDGARVLLVAPPDASGLVNEALVRAQGELFAVGLASTRTATLPTEASEDSPDNGSGAPRLPTDVYGLLVLEQREGTIIIHAWAPHATASLDARVELGAPGMTAEVLAVKAVETLRAAMLQFARRESGVVPEAVRGFTHSDEKESKPEAAPQRPPPSPPRKPPSPPVEATSTPEREPPPATRNTGASAPLGAWLGPQLSLEPGAGAGFGGQLGVLAGPRWGFVALALDTSIGTLELHAAEGSSKVTRRALALLLGGRFRPLHAWELFATAGVGYASFDVRGRGEAGYLGVNLTHESATLQCSVGADWWLTRSLGLYGSLGSVVAVDAPSVRIAEHHVATLERPAFVMSLGATAAVF